MIELKTLKEVECLVLGTSILGTGGGGDPKKGLEMLRRVIEAGKTIRIINIEEAPRDALIVVPYFVGSIAPGLKTKKPIKIKDPIKRAFEEMEKFLGKKIGAIVPSELGGENTAVALSIATELELPVINGDLLGRAAPELHQCTVHIFDIPMYPSVIITETGDVVIVKEYADIDDYESIARYISVLSGKFCAVVDTPMSYEQAEKAIVKGTLSLSLKLGEEVLNARSRGEDPIKAVVEVLNGWKIFEGIVEKYEWRDERGFLRGEAIIRGIGKYEGHRVKSWIMNEHIMVWLDDKPLVMPPDLFMLLKDDGEPITNTELREGMKVHAVAAKAPEVWRTAKGLKYFGPRRFGFNYDYIPVEELIKKAGIA